jgi:peptidoglycan/LPS O-acetylase OafA/YrhL
LTTLPKPIATTRNPRVDLLRGVSILLVLLLHFALAFGLSDSPLGDLLGKKWLGAIVWNGNYGVTMFFVISGFLITSNTLLRHGSLDKVDWRAFYVLRLARIFPSLLLALAIIVPLGCLDIPFFNNSDDGHVFPASFFVLAAGSVLTFWHNVLMAHVGWFNYSLNVYWSLSVEEVFYLVFPLACIALKSPRKMVWLCLVFVAVAPVYRYIHASDLLLECGYLACFDAIALGCIAALLARRWQPQGKRAVLLRVAGVVALASVYLWGIRGHESFGFTAVAVVTALLLVASPVGQHRAWLSFWPVRGLGWLGRHSYELYLFHIIVLAVMRNITDREHLSYALRLPWLLVFLLASALLAAVVSRYFGEPMNRWIRGRFNLRVSLQGRTAVPAV